MSIPRFCDQCSQMLNPSNTGTICTTCIKQNLQVPTNLPRPLLVMKGQAIPVSNGKQIVVEYAMPVRVTVDVDSGEVVDVACMVDLIDRGEPTATFDPQGQKLVPAIQPPKFASLDEADAWLESNPVQSGVTEAPEVLERAHALAQAAPIGNWL